MILETEVGQAIATRQMLGGGQRLDRPECGTVWVNGHAEVLPHCPFDGSKMSGVGVEFGLDGLLEYTQSTPLKRYGAGL